MCGTLRDGDVLQGVYGLVGETDKDLGKHEGK